MSNIKRFKKSISNATTMTAQTENTEKCSMSNEQVINDFIAMGGNYKMFAEKCKTTIDLLIRLDRETHDLNKTFFLYLTRQVRALAKENMNRDYIEFGIPKEAEEIIEIEAKAVCFPIDQYLGAILEVANYTFNPSFYAFYNREENGTLVLVLAKQEVLSDELKEAFGLKEPIDLSDGKFFDSIIKVIDSKKNLMKKPFMTMKLPRNLIHKVAHNDFSMSKVMLMNELEKRLNEKYNPQGLYALWEIDENSDFKMVLTVEEMLTEAGKKHFGLDKVA